MKLSKNFDENIQEEYEIYLATTTDEDDSIMSPQAFEWLKLREIQNTLAEIYEESYENCV